MSGAIYIQAPVPKSGRKAGAAWAMLGDPAVREQQESSSCAHPPAGGHDLDHPDHPLNALQETHLVPAPFNRVPHVVGPRTLCLARWGNKGQKRGLGFPDSPNPDSAHQSFCFVSNSEPFHSHEKSLLILLRPRLSSAGGSGWGRQTWKEAEARMSRGRYGVWGSQGTETTLWLDAG